jgi:uncharacterized protein (DUF1330 family)
VRFQSGGRAALRSSTLRKSHILILAFTGYDKALVWYRSAAYQAVNETRWKSGDYRSIIPERVPPV